MIPLWVKNRGEQITDSATFRWLAQDAGSGAADLTLLKGTGSATFTRAGATATTILSTGLISSAIAANTARSYYDPTTLQYLGYLAEEARTNLCIRSEEFDNAAWTKAGVTATANADVSPDGNTTADRLVETATGPSGHFASSTAGTITAGNTVTVSMFVKQGNLATCEMYLRNGASSRFAGQKFTFSGATIGAATAASVGYAVTSSGVQTFPNGWYRIWMVVTTVTDTSVIIDVYPKDATSYTGNTANYTSFWGVGMEVGAFATTYIPTAAAASTRALDLERNQTSGNISTNDYTIFMRWTPTVVTSGTQTIWATYVDANNSTSIFHNGTALVFRKRIAGANQDVTTNLSYTAGTTYRIAARASSTGGMDLFINGVKGSNNANTAASQIGTNMGLGEDGNGAVTGAAAYRDDRVWQRSLSDSEVQAL